MIWTIYCHTHVESGRRYIGLTSQTWQKRWKTHVSHAKNSKDGRWHFPNAIRKYGKDAFKCEVLDTCDSLELANEREKHWIKYFDTRNQEKGFNLALGGSHIPHPIRRNPWNRSEYRAKMTPRVIAQTQTPQARANNKAALNTIESRAKRVIASKAALARPEVRVKIESHDHRRNFTPEYQAKLSAANLKRLKDPDFRRKLSENAKGRPKSVETIEKLRVTSAGRVKSPGELAKISAAARGRKHSSEHSAKIAEKRKLRDAARIASRTHFDCKKHGPIPIADCYSKTQHGQIRYECRRCRKLLKERWKRNHETI